MNSSLCIKVLALALAPPALFAAPVTLTEKEETIPTYLSGPPDPNPMFYFGHSSQGAEGRIYPYPLYDNLTNRKGEQTYRVVYLENEYVKIGITPEIGGRLFSALDKTNGYDFIYKQHVIKPALIGLLGAWISGGIEWNIPHHHRATTFIPVQWRAEEHADGGKTVWVGELEIRQRMRWAVGYTLRPGSSVLACTVRIANRTSLVNTMLCFANVAVSANDDYQIIFPPGTQWVTHHSKGTFASWPVARQRYGAADFTKGVDVSWWKNHVEANSMFGWNYTDDFFAGYDHGKDAGIMSVADHRFVPGKKFWTWGSGPAGRLWDGILTDTDGPYIELMVGAYSDNQPDYSWLQPFETRDFTMNWYPFRGIGGVKKANLAAVVNLEVKDGAARVGFYTTTAHPEATVRLQAGDKVLLDEKIAIDPAKPYAGDVPLPAGLDPHTLRASLTAAGRELVAYTPIKLEPMPQPPAVEKLPEPKDIKNQEELDLVGQRIEQFHAPAQNQAEYWKEALRRDPGDIAAHVGLGRDDLRHMRYASAEVHFRKALERTAARYTTPRDAEPLYGLGVALQMEGQADDAEDAFAKAAWSQEWKSPAYFSLAELAAARGDYAAALDFVDRSLDANTLNLRAYGLKAAILRHLGRAGEVAAVLDLAAKKTDPLDARPMAERWLATKDAVAERELLDTLAAHPANAQELAAEYANAGLYADGSAILALLEKPSSLVLYYLADFAEKQGDVAGAAEYRRAAKAADPAYGFPFQGEMIPVLRRAIAADPQDARAPYYLGNLLFDGQPEEAVALWEKSATLDPKFPTVWRNLAQASSHKKNDEVARAKAIGYLEKAVALPGADATQFSELDGLYEAAGAPVAKRLALFESHRDVATAKDDGAARLAELLTFSGRPDEALAILNGRTFNVWEGDTAYDTAALWTDAHLARGRTLLAEDSRAALADFEAAGKYPLNLRAHEFKRPAEVGYWIGRAQAALGDKAAALAAWEKAAAEPAALPPDRKAKDPLAGSAERAYRAMVLAELGQVAAAKKLFRQLIADGKKTLASPAQGKGGPRERKATAHTLMGLAYAGLGEKKDAQAAFRAALAEFPAALGAKLALTSSSDE